jgi:hypothetical protein
LTYFTVDDLENNVPIKSKTRDKFNYCVGADLDEDVSEFETKSSELVLETNKTREDSFPQNHNQEVSFLKKIFFWICGIEKILEKKGSASQAEIDTTIHQDPNWSSFCNYNAILAIALSGFFYGFFYKYN